MLEKYFIRMKLMTTPFEIFCELMLHSQFIVISAMDLDDIYLEGCLILNGFIDGCVDLRWTSIGPR